MVWEKESIYDIDVIDFIGNHECADYPTSLFDDQGKMRSTSTKSDLVKALKMKTGVHPAKDMHFLCYHQCDS